MPFVTFPDVKNYIPQGLHAHLQKAGVVVSTTIFDEIEAEAAKKVRDLSGLEIPVAVADPIDPDWIRVTIAHIITKFAAAAMSSTSEELLKDIDRNYKAALLELERRGNEGTDEEDNTGIRFAGTAEIDSVQVW